MATTIRVPAPPTGFNKVPQPPTGFTKVQTGATQGPSNEQLFEVIGGRLPSERPIRQTEGLEPTEMGFNETLAMLQRTDELERKKRQAAVQELQNRGLSLDQIEQQLPVTFGEQMKRDAGAMVGGTAGGISIPLLAKAIATTGKVGGAAGVALAGLGAGAFGTLGTSIQQTIELVQAAKKSQRGERLTLRERELAGTPESELLKQQLKAGGIEALTEVVPRLLFGGVGKLTKGLRSKIIPGATELSEKLAKAGRRAPTEDLTPYAKKLFRKKGAFLTPAQLTESRGMDFVESATEGSIFGGNRIFQIKKVLNPKAYKQMTREISGTLWEEAGKRLSNAETGKLFVDTIAGGQRAINRTARMLYSQIDETTKGVVRVDLRPVKKVAQKLIAEAEASKDLGSAGLIRRVAEKVGEWGDEAESFMQGHSMRSNLLEEGRKLEAQVGVGFKSPKLKRAIRLLSAKTDRQMSIAARAHSNDTYLAWRAANKTVNEGRKTFQNDMVKSAVKFANRKPQKVAGQIFQSGADDTIAAVKKAVDDKTWKTLKASWVENLLKTEGEAIPSGKALFAKLDDMTPSTLNAIFGDAEHVKDLFDIARVGQIIQAPTGGGGGMIIQLTQAAELAIAGKGIVTGRPKLPGVILWGPAIVGRILSTKTGAELISQGLRMPVGSKGAGVLIARLTREAAIAKREEASRRQRQQLSISRRDIERAGP